MRQNNEKSHTNDGTAVIDCIIGTAAAAAARAFHQTSTTTIYRLEAMLAVAVVHQQHHRENHVKRHIYTVTKPQPKLHVNGQPSKIKHSVRLIYTERRTTALADSQPINSSLFYASRRRRQSSDWRWCRVDRGLLVTSRHHRVSRPFASVTQLCRFLKTHAKTQHIRRFKDALCGHEGSTDK